MKPKWFSVPSKRLVALVFLGVLALWLGSLVFVPALVGVYFAPSRCGATQTVGDALVECERLSALYGTFGDSFGAVNALFSGLALAGVVLTLFLHSEGARRSAKPFVVPRLSRSDAAARATIRDPERMAGSIRLPLQVSIPIQNSSSYVALNVDVGLKIDGMPLHAITAVEIPLAPDDREVSVLSIDVTGHYAERFVQMLRDGGVKITVHVSYGSVEDVRWITGASYVLTQNENRTEDRELLEAAINGQLAAETPWTAETTVELDFATVRGSWQYKESH